MGQTSSGEQRSPPTTRRARRDVAWVILVWGRVVLGLALATVGGVAFGHAWTQEYAPSWWVGAITLLTGILLILSGVYARSYPPGVRPDTTLQKEPSEGEEPLVPLLGSLLVYKYQWITQKQLNEALERQRKEKEDRRLLGEILLAMGAITRAQLEDALEYQRSVLREKTAARAR